MKVYRVFERYHASGESGTIEYGIFSSKEVAAKRAWEIWNRKGYPNDEVKEFPGGSLFCCKDPFEVYDISVQEYELDEEINVDITGYT